MAITYGAAVGASQLQVGIEITQTPEVITAATTSVTLTARFYARAGASINDAVDLNIGAPFHSPTKIRKTMNTVNTDVFFVQYSTGAYALKAGQPQTVAFGAWITDYWAGLVPTVDAPFVIPARPVVEPLAPSGVSAVRQSDSHAVVQWLNHPSEQGIYEQIVINRFDGTTWTEVMREAGWVTGWNDYGIQPNRRYQYAVKARNAAGDSAWVYSGWIRTTPATPSGVKTVKTGATTATVSWTDASGSETGFEVRRSTDNGATWTIVGTAAENAALWTDAATPAGSVIYAVRAIAGPLASGWSASTAPITTSAPPSAPTVVPLPAYALLGSPLSASWQHATVDGSTQSKAEVEVNGTIHPVASAASAFQFTPDATGLVRVRVRTWGGHATAGPWSPYVESTVVNPPSVVITEPAISGELIADLPVTVTWSPSSQSSWALRLLRADAVVDQWSGALEREVALTSQHLTDDSSFTLELTIRDQYGHTATAERTFVTDFVPPAKPVLLAQFEESTAAVRITGSIGDEPDVPPTSSLALTRIEHWDGQDEVTLLADPLAPGTIFTDRTPRMGRIVHYRLVAAASNGATAETLGEVDTTTPSWYRFNFGRGLAESAQIALNVSTSESPRRSKSHFHFAGRSRPVAFFGERKTRELALSGDLLDDHAAEQSFKELAVASGDVVYRSPRGDRHKVSVDVDLKEGTGPRIVAVDVSMVEVG